MELIKIIRELMPIIIELMPMIRECMDKMEPKRQEAVMRYISDPKNAAKMALTMLEINNLATNGPEGGVGNGDRAKIMDALNTIATDNG